MSFFWWRNFKKKPVVPPPVFPSAVFPARSNRGGLPVSVRSEPIIGYRLWRVKPTLDGLALYSLHFDYEWQTENTAECRKDQIPPNTPFRPRDHKSSSPGADCSCGLYVMLPDHEFDEWRHRVAGKVHASGTVALTGRVIRCTLGYKAEQAEIQSPVVLDVSCAASHNCGGDVTRVDLQRDYARGWCDLHAPKQGALVEAGMYLREAARQLEVKYPGVEFISYHM